MSDTVQATSTCPRTATLTGLLMHPTQAVVDDAGSIALEGTLSFVGASGAVQTIRVEAVGGTATQLAPAWTTEPIMLTGFATSSTSMLVVSRGAPPTNGSPCWGPRT